jgi:thiol:disulfide interchange protein
MATARGWRGHALVALIIGLPLMLGATPGGIRGSAKPAPVQAELQLITPEVVPDETFSVAIDLQVNPGWHMGPLGDPDEDPNALTLQWTLPEGFVLTHLSGPQPDEHGVGELAWRGYVDHVRLIAEIRAPAQIMADRVALQAEMDWVACGTSCIPGSSHLQIDLPARKQAIIEQSLAGAVAAAPAQPAHSSIVEFLGWAGLAFLGGLLLNLMPCVLPVLSLKAMQLMQLAREGRRKIVASTIAYALGVVGSFLALGAVFVLFKSAGIALGWGFQLQSPLFVGALCALLVLLGMSLTGVFELGTSLSRLSSGKPKRSGWVGSFLSGALTTLVATPCTGPFLGSAMAFGMTLPILGQFGILLAMAMGLVAPFLLFIPFPGLLERLPKPGPWMEWLKKGMGLLVLGSAAWLLWVFAALTGGAAWIWWSAGLASLVGAVLLYGRMQWRAAGGSTGQRLVMGLLLGAMGGSFWQAIEQDAAQQIVCQQEDLDHRYSKAKAEQLLAQGKPILVDFTARWCLLCQANKPVLHSQEVQDLLREREVEFLEADVTRRQPELMQQLADWGREGVPAYVLLAPGQSPQFLPEVLTADAIRAGVEQISLPQAK